MTVDQFLRFGFEEFHKNGFDISLICDMDKTYVESLPEYIHPYPVKMSRGIDPKGMFNAINEMTKIFKENRFDIVQYSTPNASFYASIAAKKAKIPVRLYCQWGLVYLGFSGIKRKIFKFIEKTVCKNSTDVQPDSKGNLDLCRGNGFYSKEKSRVVWNGSANGIDLDKFDYSKKELYSQQIHKEYNISEDKIVLGFLGRVGKDKGFEELMASFKMLNKKYDNLCLLYVGPNEKPDTVSHESLEYFEKCPDIIYTGGWVDDTERYFAAMDILIFPSYREGFGSVVIEAESMGVPVVVSDIPGPQNGMLDGVTGYKVPAREVDPIVEKTSILIEDELLREQFGKAGNIFVRENFAANILIKKIIENRNWLLTRTQGD
jgi:glycosyltransferase involved in cell wall biosynthesis